MNKKGFFLVIEGGEGSGKTTLVTEVAKLLHAITGQPVVETTEPGGTPMAYEIRNVVIKPRDEHVCPITELLLMMASRRQHFINVILPATKAGSYVISGRFVDSSYALQHCAGQVSFEDFDAARKITIGDYVPDLTVVLDIDPELTWDDVLSRKFVDRMESKGLDYHQLVRQGFLKAAAKDPSRYLVIPARMDLVETTRLVVNAVLHRQSNL